MIPVYRAFHKAEKKMYCVAGIHHIMEPGNNYHEPEMPITEEVQEVFVVDDLPTCEKVWWMPVSEVELIPRTPFKDRNGQALYVGDILQDYFGKRALVIEFTDEQNVISGFTLKSLRSPNVLTGTYEIFRGSWLMDAQVIGNMWEHPELLETQEEAPCK